MTVIVILMIVKLVVLMMRLVVLIMALMLLLLLMLLVLMILRHLHLTRAVLLTASTVLLSTMVGLSLVTVVTLLLIVKASQQVVQSAHSVGGVFLLFGSPHGIAFSALRAHRRIVPLHVADGALNFRVGKAVHGVLRNDLVQILFRDPLLLAIGRLVATRATVMANPSLVRVATLVQLASIDPVFLRREVGERFKR